MIRRGLLDYKMRTSYPSGCTVAIWEMLEKEIGADLDPSSVQGEVTRRATERVSTRPVVTHRYGNQGQDGWVDSFVSYHSVLIYFIIIIFISF